MQNLQIVKSFQASHHANKNFPNRLLLKQSLLLLVLHNFLEQIPIIRILHHNAQRLRRLINEAFLIADDIGIFNRCQYSDFVNRIFFLLRRQILHPDLFQRVNVLIRFSDHLVHVRVGPFPKPSLYFKMVECCHC